MKPMARYERILKDLDACATLADEGGKMHRGLDDKLAACRMTNTLREARRTLRLQYYEFEDAVSEIQPERWRDID